MVHAFSRAVTRVFDLLVAPFGDDRSLALIVISLLCGVAMIFIFRATSNQAAIKRTRDRFKARILEMRLYQDDLVLILRALGGALATNLSYLRVSLAPILVLVAFVILIFIQLDERYGRAPLGVGETTVLSVTLKEGADVMAVPVSLEPSGGVGMDSAPVRVGAERSVHWRLRVREQGMHSVTIKAYDKTYEVPVVAALSNGTIGREREARSALSSFLHPGLPAIGKDAPIAAVNLVYPGSRVSFFGWHTHWLVVFIICSFVGALVPKFIFGIEI